MTEEKKYPTTNSPTVKLTFEGEEQNGAHNPPYGTFHLKILLANRWNNPKLAHNHNLKKKNINFSRCTSISRTEKDLNQKQIISGVWCVYHIRFDTLLCVCVNKPFSVSLSCDSL